MKGIQVIAGKSFLVCRRKCLFESSERTEMIKIILQHGQVDDYELTLRSKDNRTVIVSLNAICFMTTLCTYRIEGSLRDISDRKKAEEELIKINKELKINKKLLEDHELKLNQMIYNLEESEHFLLKLILQRQILFYYFS